MALRLGIFCASALHLWYRLVMYIVSFFRVNDMVIISVSELDLGASTNSDLIQDLTNIAVPR